MAPSVDLQCADAAIAGETEAVGQLRRTAIESAGHFHEDDRAPILLRAFERFCRDAILCAGFLFLGADRVRTDDVASFVMDGGIRREAGNHRVDVVRVLRREITSKNVWQHGLHERRSISHWDRRHVLLY
jgi:hypothetical protein